MFQPKIHEYAERLTATLPDPLKCVYFVNSGSEANYLAMYMARLYTENFDIISFRNAYHGRLTGSVTWLGDLLDFGHFIEAFCNI